jgi:hypothetical protein
MTPNNLPFADKKRDKALSATDIFAAYPKYQELIKTLKHNLPEDWNTAPNRLGSGRHAVAFSLNGTENLVARLLHSYREHGADDAQIQQKAKVGARTRGIPHLEQIVATSVEDAAVVSERAPGLNILGLTSEALNEITDEQIIALIDAAVLAQENDIVFDPGTENLMYDPDHGFTVIDLQLEDNGYVPLDSIAKMLNVSQVTAYGLAEDVDTTDAQNIHESIDLMTRLSALAQSRLKPSSALSDLLRTAELNILCNQEVLDSRKPKGIKKLGKFVAKKLKNL